MQRSADDGSIGTKSGSQPNDLEDLLSFVERDDLVNG
jgi:hypothetical protein